MNLKIFAFFFALLSLGACKKDDDTDINLLSYDGPNASAPELVAGTHVLAVRFPGSDLQSRIGKKLVEIEAFVDVGATSYKAVVFGPGTATAPGPMLREVDFTSSVNTRKWAIVKLDPLEITGEDLWIGVKVVHDQTAQTIGCDSGPRKDNGDWIWDNIGQIWQTFLAKTGTESVNWNIRGHLE